MYGRAGEERKRGRHMWTGSTRGNSGVVGDVSSFSSSISPAKSFSKNGRKISVGDCALFKSPQGSPPFIGIIRWLSTGKDNELRLCVNWLYRPSEVTLGKGILLEAVPNEVFYSFHKDEIPAASLLHPCKVAFLAKGVKLPSGICSFVCRRVYDITNKCLWWLTDQDYINERQEEVDQLLYKTQIEMHGTAQPGGRSPKPMNGPTSASQLKSSSDVLSQVKGKKRERVDQGSEPVKRERSSKMDDGGGSGHFRSESFWKSEIAKFTEKGGLVDTEGVEKLVQLMLPERTCKKIDLVGRSILAGVIAATDKFDCLNRFVQLRGLPVFDEWLQEVHKGKIGEGSSPKDNDKTTEEFLFVLLRALDKLPVNLHALQMCYIGKSVNHLRTHKNLEIQKKARSLVDTWKKRVEAEMDAKSGSNHAVSWAARQSRLSGATSEIAMKSSATAQLSASKNANVKLVQGESKSVSAPPGSLKSSPSLTSVGNHLEEGRTRNLGVAGACDMPLIAVGDDKSSSSSQSHNNSQSCSSDHAKSGGYFGKEDARSSTAVSKTTSKARHRKFVNGFPWPTSSAVKKENGSSKNLPLQQKPNTDKLPQSSMMCEKVADGPAVEVNNYKLTIKLSNRGGNLGRSASGGSIDDSSVMTSRGSSPIQHDQFDSNAKDKSDACRISGDNAESWQSDDFKEVLTGSDDGDRSPATVPDENNSRTGDDTGKSVEIPKDASLFPGNECKSVKLQDASFSSMNALIESCVKYSEPNMLSISGADNVGMNLLASVATGEMSQLETASPIPSPQKSPPGDDSALECRQPAGEKCGSITAKNTEDKSVFSTQEKLTEGLNGHLNTSNVNVQQVSEPCLESNVKTEDKFTCKPLAVLSSSIGELSSNGKESGNNLNEGIQSLSKVANNSMDHEHKADVLMADEADNGSQALKKPKTEASNIESAVSDHKGNCGVSIRGNKGSEQIAEQQTRSGGSRSTEIEADETEESTSEVMGTTPSSAGDSNKEAKVEFDLNEGFNSDDGRFGDLNNSRVPESSSSVQLISPFSMPISAGSSGLPASVTVASAAKRPFVPPDDLLKNKVELGWKGSAATSAFRPAEPRKSLESPLTISNSSPDVPVAKVTRPPLDIDLNVADEIMQEDLAFRTTLQGAGELANNYNGPMVTAPARNSGGLDLDLNRVDEPTESHMLGGQLQPVKSPMGGVYNRELRARRDFDLNGPLIDEASVLHSLPNSALTHAQPSVPTLRINNSDMGNFSSWFTQGNHPYSAVAPGGSQRILAASAISTPFTPDVYRGPVLSSSPAVPYPSAPFQYPVFSFGNFPLHSTAFSGGSTAYVDSPSGGRICFPTMHPQVLGPAGPVQSHYNRPFGRQGLDLNTGPFGPDFEGRDESSLASRQLSVANSQAVSALRRKEPDEGWESYKQAHWQ